MVSNVCYLYHFWPSPLFKSIWGIGLVIVSFIIPILIMLYCYGRIAWVLTMRIGSRLSSTGSDDTFHVARTNTIKTLLTVALCFAICWSNNQIYYLMYNLGFQVDWTSTYYHFTVVMVFLNSTVNPFIYLIKYRDFHDALRNCCSRKKSGSQQLSISTANSDISIHWD